MIVFNILFFLLIKLIILLFNENPNLTPEQRINTKLSKNGIIQAEQFKFNFDLLILSPLKRSIETYVHSSIKIGDVIINDNFREFMNDSSNFLELDEQKTETIQHLDYRVDEAILFLKKLIIEQQLKQIEEEEFKIVNKKYNSIGIISHFEFLRNFTKKTINKEILFGNETVKLLLLISILIIK